MARINSPSELEELRQEILSKRDQNKSCITICAGTGCLALGSDRVISAFKEENENRWLPKEVLEKVSKKLKVPLNRIQHIVTFYKAFSLVPKGRHEISI
ncbi:NAD(P)H-dependent oxidoreductase subunit E, partial [Chloroflexota bacterium]